MLTASEHGHYINMQQLRSNIFYNCLRFWGNEQKLKNTFESDNDAPCCMFTSHVLYITFTRLFFKYLLIFL